MPQRSVYPPGFTPFVDSTTCSATQWCAALTIDSLECSFQFATCDTGCIEPVNFAFLQTNGVPAGNPAPQDPTLSAFMGNANTLKMNPGDVLKVSISDVPLSSAANGFRRGLLLGRQQAGLLGHLPRRRQLLQRPERLPDVQGRYGQQDR